MTITEIYKVYGCNDDGKPYLAAEFSELRFACQYAVAQYGKIHYNLPDVKKYTYYYNEDTKSIAGRVEVIEPAQIHYMNKI